MTPETALAPRNMTPGQLTAVMQLVENGLNSVHSKTAYRKALTDFLGYWQGMGRPALTKAIVQGYRAELLAEGLAPSTVNLRLAAVRKLALEAADNGLMDPTLAAGISRAKGVKAAGVRAGNWLTKAQAQDLLNSPDTETLKGKRDQAVLAVLLGCGLRRSEVAGLSFEHVQQREGRWAIVDLIGKGNRVRTVPMPNWAKAAIDNWTQAAALEETGLIFRRINKGDNLAGPSISPQAVADIVRTYAAALDLTDLAAHDLRRSFAKLALKGGASTSQIQLNLGHASLKTTERYLGAELDLHKAPCDVLGLGLS